MYVYTYIHIRYLGLSLLGEAGQVEVYVRAGVGVVGADEDFSFFTAGDTTFFTAGSTCWGGEASGEKVGVGVVLTRCVPSQKQPLISAFLL
jgi:hypothetical protein